VANAARSPIDDEQQSRSAAPPPGSTRLFRVPTAFESLRHRNYRLLWIGMLISNSGDWMDQVALNWLVYQLTGSAVALGILNLCRLVPILAFTLIGGVIADRFERRKLMFWTQFIAMVLAFILAGLVSTGVIHDAEQFWMVLVIGVGRGIMNSFNQPARQSLISELVPKESLTNAIALSSATVNLTRVIGPAIGGILIATVGVAGAFYLNGASFLAVLWGLVMMTFPPRKVRAHKGIGSELMGGIKYVYSQPTLRTLVTLALVPMIFGVPYQTMLTVFASDVLNVGSTGLGLLTAASAVGAVVGALWVAARGNKGNRERSMILGLIGFGVFLIAFAFSPWLWFSIAMLIGVGFSQQSYMALNNTLVQENADPEYRGRVVSTLFLNRGMVPLGTILAGFGADAFGPELTVAAMAAVLVVLAIGAGHFRSSSKELEATPAG
jgi:MFS family permease